MDEITRVVSGREISISNSHKLLWPEAGITKLDYLDYLLAVSPFLLPYTRDRLLMSWRYPDGAGTRRIEEKEIPAYAPEWIPRSTYKEKDWILLNDLPTLAWVANRAALELHVPFDRVDRPDHPTDLVFDLDPPDAHHFELVREVALRLKELLDSLSLASWAKSSGATGLQVYIPILPEYSFTETRKVTEFVASYMAQTLPNLVTLDRVVDRRGQKLYFDYLQLWKMRTMPAPYSLRANARAGVSAPVGWDELAQGLSPESLTAGEVLRRLHERGDLFAPVTTGAQRQSLREILAFLHQQR